MTISELRLIKKCAELRPREELELIPPNTRGIYVLLKYRPKLNRYDVVYVGMAGGINAGIRGRLRSHSRSKRKGELWTHFSVFKVWENITKQEVEELEGLFRHIYRTDTRANRLNVQKEYKKLKNIRDNDLSKWKKNKK